MAGSSEMVNIVAKGRCPEGSSRTPATLYKYTRRSHKPQSQNQIFTNPKKKAPRPNGVGESGVIVPSVFILCTQKS